MPTQRQERINSLLQQYLSEVLQQELPEEELRLASITQVLAAPDLRTARVYVSVLGEEAAVHQALAVLHRHRRYLQRRVGEDLTLRYTPRLSFQPDYTAARAQRLEALLDKVTRERDPHPDTEAPPDDTPPEPEQD